MLSTDGERTCREMGGEVEYGGGNQRGIHDDTPLLLKRLRNIIRGMLGGCER